MAAELMVEFLVVEYTSLLLPESWILGSKIQIFVHFLDRSLLPSEGVCMGIGGNEKANFLARTVAEEEMSSTGSITFRELSFLKKIELQPFWKNSSQSSLVLRKKSRRFIQAYA
ncbi:hypothetical protein TNCV_2220421 [Trichonephila clavipes]|nr:hypothetical protein TNCV_2220421 [Trichonephila clavipes]